MKKIIAITLGFITNLFSAQVGINTTTPHQSSLLDINSTNKGVLIPKVALTSKTDIATITNPAKGLLIVAANNSGSGNTAVYEDRIYIFNGTVWDEMIENNKNAKDFLYPRLAAAGRKTSETTCTNSRSENFQLNIIKTLDGNTLASTGAITASRKGYYAWSIQLVQKMPQNAYSPYFSPGYISYEFRNGTPTTPTNQYLTFSGTVYLNSGETSEPFTWFLGDSTTTPLEKCGPNDRIGAQTVVWKYLGE